MAGFASFGLANIESKSALPQVFRASLLLI